MAVNVQIDIPARLTMQREVNRLSDLRRPLRKISDLMLESVDRNFEDGGRPSRWKQISPINIAQRRRNGILHQRPLIQSGRLRQVSTSRRTKHSIFRITETTLEQGTNDPRAWNLHHGTQAKIGQLVFVPAHVRRIGLHPVRSHQRRTPSGGITTVRQHLRARRRINVSGHLRRMDFPAIPSRPFMVIQETDADRAVVILAEFIFFGPRAGRQGFTL